MSPRLRIKVLPRADRQIEKASAWWGANRSKAPDAFREEITRAFDLLSVQPSSGILVADTPGVRQLHLNRIRYYMYYRASPGVVEILSLWHMSRGSRPKL